MMGSFAFSQTTCSGVTTKDTNCKIVVKVGKYCHYHVEKLQKLKQNLFNAMELVSQLAKDVS